MTVSTRERLLELAERCTRVERHDTRRAPINDEIHEALGWKKVRVGSGRGYSGETGWLRFVPENVIADDVQVRPSPAYTSSVDDAMSLVPSGHRVLLDSDPDRRPEWRCLVRPSGSAGTSVDGSLAATAALAISASALRARAAAMTEDSNG